MVTGTGEVKGFPSLSPGKYVLGLSSVALGWSCCLVLVIIPVRNQAQSVNEEAAAGTGQTYTGSV